VPDFSSKVRHLASTPIPTFASVEHCLGLPTATEFHGKPVYFKGTSRVSAASRVSGRKAPIPCSSSLNREPG
jgi:hypothetical protein